VPGRTVGLPETHESSQGRTYNAKADWRPTGTWTFTATNARSNALFFFAVSHVLIGKE
jgi:hypothetical protein